MNSRNIIEGQKPVILINQGTGKRQVRIAVAYNCTDIIIRGNFISGHHSFYSIPAVIKFYQLKLYRQFSALVDFFLGKKSTLPHFTEVLVKAVCYGNFYASIFIKLFYRLLSFLYRVITFTGSKK